MSENTNFSEETKSRIVKSLMDKGADRPCPRCGKKDFTLIDGFFNHAIQPALQGLILGGPSIPTIAIVCTSCGFISFHALGALGFLPKDLEKGGK